MRKYKKQKQKFYFLLSMLFMLGIGIGYAVLTEKLNISNGAAFDEMKWDIGFSNIQDNGSTIPHEAEISPDGKTFSILCDFGTSKNQETCTVKATIVNNSTFDIGLTSDPIITYDDTYIHTLTFKWNNHPTYENHTVLKDNFIAKGDSEEVILTIKSKFLKSYPEKETVSPITITLNFEEWRNGELPQKEDLAVLKSTTSSDSSAFRSSTYKSYIKTITFEDEINIPDDAVESWDIGVSQNGNVMAYVSFTEDSQSYYDLHIQSDTQLYANKDMSYWFTLMTKIETINGLELLDTSMTTNTSYMFSMVGCINQKLTYDISSLDTSSVTNMTGMFYYNPQQTNAIKELNIDVSNFDTSSVTSMASMFLGTGHNSEILKIDVSNFNTSNVTNMHSMFERTGFNNATFMLDISNFDTNKVTNMSYMFSGTGYKSTIIELDVSNFDTSNVTNMSSMFSRAGLANPNFELDVSNFETSNVTNMASMFEYIGAGSSKIKTSIDITNPNITSYSKMFNATATKTGSQITVNYTSETSDLVDLMIATKSTDSNVIKGERIYLVGEEISIADEVFNVISDNGDTITMLAKYNLGTNYKQNETQNDVIFATADGWEYTPGPKEINIQQWSTGPKEYVNQYKNYLNSSLNEEVIISSDLITLTQLKELGCQIVDDYSSSGEGCVDSPYASWLINEQNWWTRSANSSSSYSIYRINANGTTVAQGRGGLTGVRPIITISKAAVES